MPSKHCTKKHNYLLIKPELGLYYSASDYFNMEVQKTIASIDYTIPVVFNCINFFHVDYTSKQTLKHLLSALRSNNHEIIFSHVSESVRETLQELLEEFCIQCCENENEILDALSYGSFDDDEACTSLLPHKSPV